MLLSAYRMADGVDLSVQGVRVECYEAFRLPPCVLPGGVPCAGPGDYVREDQGIAGNRHHGEAIATSIDVFNRERAGWQANRRSVCIAPIPDAPVRNGRATW